MTVAASHLGTCGSPATSSTSASRRADSRPASTSAAVKRSASADCTAPASSALGCSSSTLAAHSRADAAICANRSVSSASAWPANATKDFFSAVAASTCAHARESRKVYRNQGASDI